MIMIFVTRHKGQPESSAILCITLCNRQTIFLLLFLIFLLSYRKRNLLKKMLVCIYFYKSAILKVTQFLQLYFWNISLEYFKRC